MDVFVGVDCGATHLRVGLVTPEGELIASSKNNSPLKNNPNHFAEEVKEQINKLLELPVVNLSTHAKEGAQLKHSLEIKGIGVGTPGPLDLDKGWILTSPNLGNKEPIKLSDQFDLELYNNVYFDRDTNLALLGEVWQGAAKGIKNAVMLTLGTGVGGAILLNGEIYRGYDGKAGEIGHTIISGSVGQWIGGSEKSDTLVHRHADIPVCGLGHRGCFEAWINSAKDVDEMGAYLGYGLANIVDIFNPEMIIIGGGKAEYGLSADWRRDFLPKATAVMKEVGIKSAVDEVNVVYATLGDRSGIYGGARLAKQASKS